MRRARILGTGSSVPDRVVTNAELAEVIDTSDEWIVERTGIRERRWIVPGSGMGSSDLGAEAARRAMADAGVSPAEIGLIVSATLSPDHDFPGNGPILQQKLGVTSRCATLDIRQQCTGFLHGIAMADAYVRAGVHERVLVVASEVQSTGLDVSDTGRDMTVIFADGAGAAVIGPASEGEAAILSTHMHADGQFAEDLWCEFPSSKESPRLTAEALAAGRHYPKMNGRIVYKQAVKCMPESVHEALRANELTLDDIALFVPHQANLRIIELVQRALGMPDDKTFINVDRYGNTTGASIPLALDEARRQGRVKPGDLVCMTAFGAGFAWGTSLVRF